MAMTSSHPPIRLHHTARRRRRKYRSSNAFFLTILIFSAFALFSYAAFDSQQVQEPLHAALATRDATPFASTDEEVSLVIFNSHGRST